MCRGGFVHEIKHGRTFFVTEKERNRGKWLTLSFLVRKMDQEPQGVSSSITLTEMWTHSVNPENPELAG